MKLTEQRKIEIASETVESLASRSITMKDRIEIIELAMRSLLAKKRLYERRKERRRSTTQPAAEA